MELIIYPYYELIVLCGEPEILFSTSYNFFIHFFIFSVMSYSYIISHFDCSCNKIIFDHYYNHKNRWVYFFTFMVNILSLCCFVLCFDMQCFEPNLNFILFALVFTFCFHLIKHCCCEMWNILWNLMVSMYTLHIVLYLVIRKGFT